MARNFKDLSEQEILSLAIGLEEEDGRIYGDFVDGRRESYPATAQMFEEMQAEIMELMRADDNRRKTRTYPTFSHF